MCREYIFIIVYNGVYYSSVWESYNSNSTAQMVDVGRVYPHNVYR